MQVRKLQRPISYAALSLTRACMAARTSETDLITPRRAACRGTCARTASGSNFRDRRPCYQTSSSMLWRIDNNTLANDEVHCLLVDIRPNHFEFERVISGQGLAGLRRQQLGPTLNI